MSQARTDVFVQSPNFSSRGNVPITHVIIHAAVGTVAGTSGLFLNAGAKVSAHYIVGRDAKITQYVREEHEAWHALGANKFSIGIEHEDKWRVPPFNTLWGGCMGQIPWMTIPQQAASAKLVAGICHDYNIPVKNVLGHNDPWLRQFGNNHQDPGPRFDWPEYRRLIQVELDRLAALQQEKLEITPDCTSDACPVIEKPIKAVKNVAKSPTT